METYEHLTTFVGKPVVEWDPEQPLEDAANNAYRIAVEWDAEDDAWVNSFNSFLADPNSKDVTALVVGLWGEVGTGELSSSVVVDALVEAKEKLPNLTAIFLGDILSEESEISWIEQSDISPLLRAYPNLEYLAIRGGEKLSLSNPNHDKLKTLVIQTGGLSTEVVRQVSAAELPQLEHLELWLGSDSYGGDATVDDLDTILSGERFPKLRYLGLRDSEIADEIAEAVATAPVLEQIEVLDLSLGTLGDEGAAHLLASEGIKKLKKLDLHRHYMSPETIEKFVQLGIEVDTSEAEEPYLSGGEEYRYAAVTE